MEKVGNSSAAGAGTKKGGSDGAGKRDGRILAEKGPIGRRADVATGCAAWGSGLAGRGWARRGPRARGPSRGPVLDTLRVGSGKLNSCHFATAIVHFKINSFFPGAFVSEIDLFSIPIRRTALRPRPCRAPHRRHQPARGFGGVSFGGCVIILKQNKKPSQRALLAGAIGAEGSSRTAVGFESRRCAIEPQSRPAPPRPRSGGPSFGGAAAALCRGRSPTDP